MKCETVKVTVTDEDGNTSDSTVPAYTREVHGFKVVVKGHLHDYLSIENHPSLGDFALYLVAMASLEPKEI